ncbi:hypothetical protein M422DRAFT_64163 [Sphaerobolus stellatus SS14]|nr:hypothetical protein M422DRAFT_64163 [Sphaerobolus stellatus SS14]
MFLAMSNSAISLHSHQVVRSLLQTNYILDTTETETLCSVIQGYQEDQNFIEAQFSKTTDSREFEQLEQQKHAVDSRLEHAHGLLAPIRRLPDEILREIFIMASHKSRAGDGDADAFPLPETNQTGDYLGHTAVIFLRICRRWQRIAFTTPRLFTQILVSPTGIHQWADEMPQLFQYSGALPLELFLCKLEGPICRNSRPFRTVLELFHAHIHRIKFVAMALCPWMDLVCGSNPTLNMPAMEAFELHSSCRGALSGATRLHAPKLRRLTIAKHIPRSYWEYAICFGKQLEYFANRCNAYGGERIFGIFSRCPNLEDCSLIYSDIASEDILPGRYLHLPRLRRLELEWRTYGGLKVLPYFLLRLHTPSLQELSISTNEDYEDQGLSSLLHSWIQRSGASLQTLSLNGISMRTDKLQSLLKITPDLKKLALEHCQLSEDPVTHLYGYEEPDLCPRLSIIDFKGANLPIMKLLKAIRSRLVVPEGRLHSALLHTVQLPYMGQTQLDT